jgi:glycosyltransferase involved in cell wall biosynthesis
LAAVRDVSVSYLASIFNVALVYHVHFGRVPLIADANTLEWRLIKKAMLRASAVIVLDIATSKAIVKHASTVNVILVPNCISIATLPRFPQSIDSVKTVVFMGLVVPTKGINELIKSWSIINPAGWRLDIIGSVEPWYSKQLIVQNKLKSVHFMGQLPHALAMERMAKCDLFVLPSYTEGFPNVILEAMAFGRAIVATDVGAIPEILEGGAGLLFKSQSTQSLTEVLYEILSDAELRGRMGECARKKVVEKYAIDIVFDAYMKVWRDVSNIT